MLLSALLMEGGASGQSQPASERARVIDRIERLADQDARSGSRDPRTALEAFRDNAAGLTPDQVVTIYNKRYDADVERSRSWSDKLEDNAPWLAAIFFALLFLAKDLVLKGLDAIASALGETVYGRLAGTRLLRWRAVRRYRAQLRSATAEIKIPFRPNQPLVLSDVYVDVRFRDDPTQPPMPALEALQAHRRIVLTGAPGAGKSVFLRHIAFLGSAHLDRTTSGDLLPVLIELHRLGGASPEMTLEQHIVASFEKYGFPRAGKFVRRRLRDDDLLLLLDGLDEVPAADRPRVAAQIADLLQAHPHCSVVVTCRTAVYENELDAVTNRIFEIEPFRDAQILDFLRSWEQHMPEDKSPTQLMATLHAHPKLLNEARNPLLLTIVAHLYSDNPNYALPRSRADFYRQTSQILLDQWQGHLHFNQFEGPEKALLLQQLALEMQRARHTHQGDAKTITRERIVESFTASFSTLGREPALVPAALDEIVKRSGLLIPVDGGVRYAFSHLTFQEFFAAETFVDRPEMLLRDLASDRDGWREVLKLWCGLAGNATAMISAIAATDRLLAIECVAEARAVDRAVADRLIAWARAELQRGAVDDLLIQAVGALASDVRARGTRVLDELALDLDVASSPSAATQLALALAASNRPPAAEAIARNLRRRPRLVLPLQQMGDLAVPYAAEGLTTTDAERYVECLTWIGTPAAARALVPALFRPLPLQLRRHIAWNILALVSDRTVAEALRDVPVPEGARREPSYDWIWKPVDAHGNAAWIVGHAAWLVRGTMAIPTTVVSPDPRVAVALISMDPCPLDTKVGDVPQSVLRRRPQIRSGLPSVRSFKLTESTTYRDLLDGVEGHELRGTVVYILETLGGLEPVWAALVRTIPLQGRLALFARLQRGANVNERSWRSVFTASAPAGSWAYAFALLVTALALGWLSLGAIARANGLPDAAQILTIAGCSALGGWLGLAVLDGGSAWRGFDPDMLWLLPLGWLFTIISVFDRPDDEGLDPWMFAAGLPSIPVWWFAITAIVEDWHAAFALLGFGLATVALVSFGRRRERMDSTPLAGLFAERARLDVAPSLAS